MQYNQTPQNALTHRKEDPYGMTTTLRIATTQDAAQIQAIYSDYVLNSAITFEIEPPSVDEMAGRIEKTLAKYPWIVAEDDGQILGYCYAGAFKGRAAYDCSVETSVYVKRDIRTRGIGRALYTRLEQELKRMGITNANACVAYTDQDTPYLTRGSVIFHEKMGYTLVGVFHSCAFKMGRWWDMCWFEKRIANHTQETPKITWFSQLQH